MDALNDAARIGVFVCECGAKIGCSLNLPALVEQVGQLPSVRWVGQAGYWCLPGGLERIQSIIAEQRLDRVVIGGCAPRTHEGHFRQALDGLVHPTLVNVTNLRDLCARPHQADPAMATAKARDQIAMAVADLAARQPTAPRVARITPRAVVLGGGIAGMTAALAVSDADIPVTLVEREPDLGGPAYRWPDDLEIAKLVAERMAAVRARQNVQVLTNTQVTGVSGPVGCYQVMLSDGQVIEAGIIIIATGGQRVPANIQELASSQPDTPTRYAFVLCDMTPESQATCTHSCCLATFRQAAEIKRQVPGSQVTIFFRELYTAGGTYDELVWEAQRLGVSFVRYPAGQEPQSVDGELVTHDELTGREMCVPCDLVIHATPIVPQDDAAHLVELLRIPTDTAGFFADIRIRLRPSDRIERGIYVCGAAHYPCDAHHAMFEAYSAAARAVRHIQSQQSTSWIPAAVVDSTRCNGCGDCARVCPFMAVTLAERPGDKKAGKPGDPEMWKLGGGKLAAIDSLLCTGCGNCVSACPVKAVQVPSATDEQIEAQIRAALSANGNLRHLVFACEWSGYSAAEVAGARGLGYPASTRLIRLNCTGRLQPGLILKALEMGAAGVLILGCAPGVCHFEQGSEHCASAFKQADALAHLLTVDNRLKLEWISPDDGTTFAQAVTDFVSKIGEQTHFTRET